MSNLPKAISSAKKVACPTCKNLSIFNSSNQYRPFCSERCKMIDLGDWASENYRIADSKPADNNPQGLNDEFD